MIEQLQPWDCFQERTFSIDSLDELPSLLKDMDFEEVIIRPLIRVSFAEDKTLVEDGESFRVIVRVPIPNPKDKDISLKGLRH